MPSFKDIKKFPFASYSVTVEWGYLKESLKQWDERKLGNPLIMNPDFQRGHVWTPEQQSSYVEYMLKGGTTGRDIYFNCSSWQDSYDTPIYCVDGLQRVTAALAFLDNEVPVFGGNYLKDYKEPIRMADLRFTFNVFKIKNKKDLLKVYLDFNSGGTPHDPKELARVQEMINKTPDGETL